MAAAPVILATSSRLPARCTGGSQIALVASLVFALAAPRADGQPRRIGIIDFYGLRNVTAERARAVLTFTEGDPVSLAGEGDPAALTTAERQLATLPGVVRARIDVVCCDAGRAIVYVGIEERGSAALSFRPAPTGDARLAPDIVQSGEAFSTALVSAIERGDAAEDRSQGHSFAHDPAARAVQERFVTFANRDLPALRRVLRNSSSVSDRALAAQVLGYAADKAAVVDDLVYGMSDLSESVRNNAMRALMVIAEMTPAPGRSVPRIPHEPFIALLNSPVWSDRNKASGALMALTTGRDPKLLGALRRQAATALAEMARWKSEGHALPAFVILARLAGYSDDDAFGLWQRGEREAVIGYRRF